MKHQHFVEHCQSTAGIVPTLATEDELAFAQELRTTSRQPHELIETIDQIKKLLLTRRGNETLLVILLEMMERKGDYPDMAKNWDVLAGLFPSNETCFRMQVRWMRRDKRIGEGLELIAARYPDRTTVAAAAVGYLIGLQELKLSAETDAFFQQLPKAMQQIQAVQLAYMRNLFDQERYAEAAIVAKAVAQVSGLPTNQNLPLSKALHYGAICEMLDASGAQSPPAALVQMFAQRVLTADRPDGVGRLSLFTSQLAAGGAERQFVRIAANIDRAAKDGLLVGQKKPDGPIKLTVHHSDPSAGKDFFVSYLHEAGLGLTVLDDLIEPQVKNPFKEFGEMGEIYLLLPKKLRKAVRRMAVIYREDRTDTAYIWQDNGMHVAALAALAAGVPRIILCFRSTPLKIRKDFFKPGFEGYFETLVRVPGVFVACNSHIMARKYADWLGLDVDDVAVVPNAATDHEVRGDIEDEKLWGDICAVSADCTKTVLGVFRLHPVKRADVWILLAQKYLERDPNTRFVIAGTGDEYHDLKRMIVDRGLSDKVFLVGRRKAMGFWLNKADVVLHCAMHEGLPNAILEAQLAGRAVIATPAGGTSEAFLPDQSGICLSQVEPFPFEEALQALETLLSDAELRLKFGRAGREFVRKNFSMESSLSKTMELLCSPLESQDV